MNTETTTPLACIILAAGKGTRMKSDKPKVLHEIAGLPMIKWLISSAEILNPEKIIIVAGEGMHEVAIASEPHIIAVQKEQNGTGGAVKAALSELKDFNGDVLILLADAPLISTDTMEELINAKNIDPEYGLSVLGVELDDPTGYGRLIADEDGKLEKIVEHKDATEEELRTDICNTGAFCVNSNKLSEWVNRIKDSNSQKELYLTDLPEIAKEDGYGTAVCVSFDEEEVMGINSKTQLAIAERYVQRLLRSSAMEAGALLYDPTTVYFSYDTMLGQDVIVEPNVYFGKNVTVADGVTIKAFSHIEGANINRGAIIGPFARIRPGTEVGENAKVGNFVEVKNSSIGDGAKISHLSYIGDASLGDNSNIGAGTITCNYNGFEKNKTIIGENAFIGANSTLIAPVNIGNGAYVGAGSVINKNIDKDDLGLTRVKQENKKEWAANFRRKKTRGKAII